MKSYKSQIISRIGSGENRRQFRRALVAFSKKVNRNLDDVMKDVAGVLFGKVVYKTPVRTGRARGNWFLSTGERRAGSTTLTDKDGYLTYSRGLMELEFYHHDDPIFITNLIPYIHKLEDGYSRKAPEGILRPALRELQQEMEAVIAKVRNNSPSI